MKAHHFMTSGGHLALPGSPIALKQASYSDRPISGKKKIKCTQVRFEFSGSTTNNKILFQYLLKLHLVNMWM